jgi:hypothetical protein
MTRNSEIFQNSANPNPRNQNSSLKIPEKKKKSGEKIKSKIEKKKNLKKPY